MVQKSGKLKFETVWTFPEDVEQRIKKFLEAHPGNWLHAPCGDSKVGIDKPIEGVKMTTFDIDETRNPDIVGDLYEMTENPKILDLGQIDGVISDPVWKKVETCANCKEPIETRKGISYPWRRHLAYQVRDILKPGGWWIMNCLWDPSCKGLPITPNEMCPSGIETVLQSFNSYRNVSLLVYLKKNE